MVWCLKKIEIVQQPIGLIIQVWWYIYESNNYIFIGPLLMVWCLFNVVAF